MRRGWMVPGGGRRRAGGADAEAAGGGDRLRAGAAAQAVADDAAQSGVRPAVRVNRGRVVVGLDFEADVELVVELDDAGVVLEDADAPRPREVLGGPEHGRFEEVRDALAVEVDVRGQRLV